MTVSEDIIDPVLKYKQLKGLELNSLQPNFYYFYEPQKLIPY
jgi:hypothetical protein